MENINFKLQLPFLMVVMAFVLASCSKEQDDLMGVKTTAKVPNDDYISQIKALGFDTSSIVDMGDYFIVENRIILRKIELPLYNMVTTRQARKNFIIANEYRYDIKVYIDSNVPTSWIEPITNAISSWNGFKGLHFRRVTSAPYDIRFSAVTWLNALVTFPSANGKPGADIFLPETYTSGFSASKKLSFAIGAVGFNLGIMRTDWATNNTGGEYGIGIAGTPNSGKNPDPSSIFNGNAPLNEITIFSNYDKTAINTLFPSPTIVAPSKICYGASLDLTITNKPNNATVSWSTSSNFTPSEGSGDFFTCRNVSSTEDYGLISATYTFPDGAEHTIYCHIQTIKPGYITGVPLTQNSNETSCFLYNYDNGRNFRWSCAQGEIQLQGLDWTWLKYWSTDGITVTCEYIDNCGNTQRVSQTFHP